MNEKEEKAVCLIRQMGQPVATFSTGVWSANGGPWLRKLGQDYVDAVAKNLDKYLELYIYRCGRVVPTWYVIGKLWTPQGPTYHAVYGFSSQTVAVIGIEARVLRSRWWFAPYSVRRTLSIGFACAGVLLLECCAVVKDFWLYGAVRYESTHDVVWSSIWIALFFVGVLLFATHERNFSPKRSRCE